MKHGRTLSSTNEKKKSPAGMARLPTVSTSTSPTKTKTTFADRFRFWKRPLTLFGYQEEVVRYLMRDDVVRFIACWDMGLGKTILGLSFAEANLWSFYSRNPPPTLSHDVVPPVIAVVVASPTVQTQFRATLKDKFGRSETHIDTFYRFWSYEGAAKRSHEFSQLVKKQIVIVDEIHTLRTEIVFQRESETPDGEQERETQVEEKEATESKPGNPGEPRRLKKGRRASLIFAALWCAWKVLGLSGTILVNRLSDLWNVTRMILGGRQTSTQELEILEANVTVTALKKGILTDNAMETLKDAWHGRVSFQTAETAGISHRLPRSKEINVLIEMNDDYYQAYKAVEKSEYAKLKERNETILGDGAFWSGLRQAANELIGVSSQKREFVVRLLGECKRQGKRVVITSSFISRGLKTLCDDMSRMGISYVRITGDVPESARRDAVRAFNDPKSNVDAIVLSTAGTTGTDLGNSQVQINLESLWSEAVRKQTNARSVRLGSRHKEVLIYNLFMVKPGPDHFDSAVKEMHQHMEQKAPGAPDFILPLPFLGDGKQQGDQNDLGIESMFEKMTILKEDARKKLLSIDVRLYQLQIRKSAVLTPVLDTFFPTMAVEKHPNWKQCFRNFLLP